MILNQVKHMQSYIIFILLEILLEIHILLMFYRSLVQTATFIQHVIFSIYTANTVTASLSASVFSYNFIFAVYYTMYIGCLKIHPLLLTTVPTQDVRKFVP